MGAAGGVVTELPKFGRYVTLERLGAGAAGEVFRARDEMLARDVAIKTVKLVGRNASLSLERFFHEARAVAALSHPSVIRVYDMGEEDGTPYLVMELAQGGSLKERLEHGPALRFEEVSALGIQIGQALAAAHARGIVHRDVKPANVLHDSDGVWRLADFGVAHVPDSTLTLAGQFLGSPAYAAPESLEEGMFGAASDVWGLAATLYEALTGESPWGERDYAQILMALDGGPPRLATRAPTLPAQVAAALDRALSRRPADRPSAQELAAALAGGGASPSISSTISSTTMAPVMAGSSRRTLLIAGVAAILIIGLVAALAGRSKDDAAPSRAGSGSAPVKPLSSETVEQVDDPVERPISERAAERWEEIRELVEEHDWKDAEKELERFLDEVPGDAEALRVLDEVRKARAIEGDKRGKGKSKGKGKKDD